MSRLRNISILLALSINFGFAQETPCKCCSVEYHQFDFWIGEWDVFNPKGVLVGTNKIETIQDSCGLKENWKGQKGGSGTSYNFYDRKTERWNQLWLDNNGGNLQLTGKFSDGSMVLESRELYSEKKKTAYRERITWTGNADGTVRQHWQRTTDDGKTWATVFDGLYKRKQK